MEQSNKKKFFINHINLYRNTLFTCIILFIYIVGSNIPLIPMDSLNKADHFYQIAAANMGGDVTFINLFSLGLGPWLTAMLFISLYYYKQSNSSIKRTKRERQRIEKVLMLIISIFQAFMIAFTLLPHDDRAIGKIVLIMLVLVAGSFMLVWLADQNALYGLAGPMPIVAISVVKSIFRQGLIKAHFGTFVITIIALITLVIVISIIFMELSVLRLPYIDMLSVTKHYVTPEVTWKLNPSSSLSIMLSVSLFLLLKHVYDFVVHFLHIGILSRFDLFTFAHIYGIVTFMLLLFWLSYNLSMLMLNPERKANEFKRNGNYFAHIEPGKQTAQFLKKKARHVSFIGAIFVVLCIGIPLILTLLLPDLYKEIYLAIQVIILIFIGFNIKETINTYLYFDQYKVFLKKYW
ncbi:accessory Sec system protein translocase subunit SecY2 [Macrococcus caseolyticus]|nr:accessory Sec system protein translocase subunit SecY2 [Macrococcus caseolyticus]